MRYRVTLGFRSGTIDQYELVASSTMFTGWNERISKGESVSFYDVDNDLIVVNTKFLETYAAVSLGEEE